MALYVGDTRYKVMVGNQKHDFVVPLPYDAEVEWLQSDGNAYIDTGIKVAGNLSANVHLVDFFDSESVGRSAFGGQIYIEEGEWDYDTKQFGFGINQDGKAVFYYDDSNIVLDDYSTYPQSARVVIENGVISIGSEQYTYTTASFTTLRNIILFGWNNGLIFNTPCKMGPCYLSDGTTTLDLIPVRKDDVGYMYDKISGKLFGREETGNFIIGPDKVLPYDAEIEYIESTGTQWVDIGINLRNTMQAQMSFNTTALQSVNEALFGVWYDNVSVPHFMLWIRNTNKWGVSGNDISVSGVTNNTNVSANTDYNVTINATASQASDATLYVFARNNDINDYVPATIKLYSLKITVGSNLVRDFIPVRKGTIGYLYDKVSRQLFGNAGTGNFIIGNDVTT